MIDQISNDVENIVEEIFKKKEEAEMKKETEDALASAAETIVQLNASLEAKDTEHLAELSKLQETITALETQLNTIADAKKVLEDEKAKFEENKVKFEEEKADLIKRAESAELTLENIKKDQVAASRMTELESSGVASNDKVAQLSKIREMSSEDFETYRTELVSIREAVVAQLQTVNTATDTATVSDAQDIKNAALNTQQSIDTDKAAAAALNMESAPVEDLLTKYRELGSQMAINVKSKK